MGKEYAYIVPTGDGIPVSNHILLATDPGYVTEGSTGGLLGLLLPAILFASIIPGLIPPEAPPALPSLPAAPPCPVCAAPVTCTTPAPCMPVPTCPPGFVKLTYGGKEVPDKCYLFILERYNFIEQLGECIRKGGSLTNPMTEDEGRALKTYLQNNYAGLEFYLGYTDLGHGNVLYALSGGPTSPIPGLDEDALKGVNSRYDDCTSVVVDKDGKVNIDTTNCRVAVGAICEVNLKRQNCICK